MEKNQITTINSEKPVIFQIFYRSLTGKTLTLNFSTPYAYTSTIKNRIHEITKIPIRHLQRLLYHGTQLEDNTVITEAETTVHLVPRLVGGKGGFGSLLRGAATKAGQKKTNNFDACRDMSGRRLRHVNAEKKLEEWRMEEEERKLERIAEDFIKKKSKTGKKGVGDGAALKYVEKYREESAKCVAVVEETVREAFGKKRKKTTTKKKEVAQIADAKRLKIWAGKRKLVDSDKDSSDDDSDEENEKSIVLNSGNHSDSNKENEGSSGSVTGGKLTGEFSGSEEEKEIVVKQNLESGGSSDVGDDHDKEKCVVELEIREEKAVQTTSVSFSEAVVVSETEAVQAEKQEFSANESMQKVVAQPLHASSSENGKGSMSKPTDSEANGYSDLKSGAHDEAIVVNTNIAEPEKPLNFDEFNSAAEMEVLGLERLKSELQAHGLKCGGTLQERAARLFLLKSTPLEKLPKKLLAKK